MKQGQRLLDENGFECALFPMEVLNNTQSPFTVGDTHEGTMNIDLAGADGGISPLFASCDMTVVKNSNTDNHEIIWWYDKKVRWANDTVDYISIRHLHDDVVTDLPVGTRKRQGEKAFDEGNTGQSQGNHSHLCVARGHTKSIKVHESGYRDLVGSVMPNEVFFVNDTIIKNARGLVWKVYAPSYAKMREVIGKQYCTLNN
jgi:hypothetical protein